MSTINIPVIIWNIFATDIRSHKQCMNRYLLQYKRDLNDSNFCNLEDFDEELREEFSLMVILIYRKLTTPFFISNVEYEQ